jgi:hypothetical protein
MARTEDEVLFFCPRAAYGLRREPTERRHSHAVIAQELKQACVQAAVQLGLPNELEESAVLPVACDRHVLAPFALGITHVLEETGRGECEGL